MHFLRELWDNVREFITTVGSVALFFGRVLVQLPAALLRPSLVVEQVQNLIKVPAFRPAPIVICGFQLVERQARIEHTSLLCRACR